MHNCDNFRFCVHNRSTNNAGYGQPDAWSECLWCSLKYHFYRTRFIWWDKSILTKTGKRLAPHPTLTPDSKWTKWELTPRPVLRDEKRAVAGPQGEVPCVRSRLNNSYLLELQRTFREGVRQDHYLLSCTNHPRPQERASRTFSMRIMWDPDD